jgi:hypothetical protein
MLLVPSAKAISGLGIRIARRPEKISPTQAARMRRDLVPLNLAIDSKLHACDLVKVCSGAKVWDRAVVVQTWMPFLIS